MRYQKAVNVWSLTALERAQLKPGQWVYAGNPQDKGIWCGVRSSGSDVVAWYQNAKRRNFRQYVQTLLTYARG